jgi:flagellar basal-body rod modification protein FlgD
MSVSSISSSTIAVSTNAAASTQSTDTTGFLNLLVAQLQGQNPLDPTDTGEFMDQVMSFAGIEQQQAMNDQLNEMASSINNLLSASAVSCIGRTVEAYGDTTSLEDGEATWGYSLNADAAEVGITVKDADGNIVWEGEGETGAGRHTFTWDGKTTSGTQLSDGEYSIEISATDAGGDSVYGYTTIVGQVDGVDSTSGEVLLTVGGVTVSFESVIGIRA